MQRVANFRNRRYNSYVPACGYAADVIHGAAYEVDFLTPVAASVVNILAAIATTINVPITVFAGDTADAPFGRNVVLAGAGVGARVEGKDYLGQPMAETIAAAGTGLKAFKWIDRIIPDATAASLSAGWGARLGLPYRMSAVQDEIANGAEAAVGTLYAPVLTDPQTLVTGDPRGTYTPTTALNGSNRILARFLPYNILNANGNGGLHGIAHVAA
jgi:hypothetical protein